MGIGAKLARPKQQCICIVGDGSMLMRGMELHTAVRYKVPLVIVIINNSALGNVYLRAWKAGKEDAELSEIKPSHNWADFGKSLGAEGIVVEKPEELHGVYERALKHILAPNTPFVIDVICDKDCEPPNQ
jgi:acetolactate synthase I/II/III large subunit